MAHYTNQYGAPPTDDYANPTRRTDEYGNPVGPRVDEYGNPLGQHGATTGTTPATGGGYGTTTGAHDTRDTPTGYAATTAAGHGVLGHDYDRKEHHGVTGRLHRSGSSSSSSSEDDGLGGRRKKKELKEKIKEKLPGTAGHRDDPYSSHSHATSTTTPYGGTAYTEEHHEKKGIMDKIKEKLPGTGHQ